MKAIILAGGLGTRLRDVVNDLPKPMAPIGGRPFLEYLVLQLIRWNIKEVILSVGYKGDVIKAYFGNGSNFGVHIRYSEEKVPLGTGGAIKQSLTLIDDEEFLVMNGDSFLHVDFHELIYRHCTWQAKAAISLVRTKDTSRYGLVERNEIGEVVRFAEKGSENNGLINGGVYIFRREVFTSIPSGNVSLEREILPSLANQGLYGIIVNGFFIDIGVPRDYLTLYHEPERLLDTLK
ncbi:MAG: nucleotidyltransferase family protein [Candidatus Brocadia sp.]|nr:nucleotidyltransferase family protein [Candidatus Brocadia sp.]